MISFCSTQLSTALIQSFYPGVLGGQAIAGALFGDFSPAGRMPATVVTGMTQLPPYNSMQMSATPGRTYHMLSIVQVHVFVHAYLSVYVLLFVSCVCV